MEILLKKQPQKYLKKLDEKTRAKLYAALDEVSEFRGDIRKLAGMKNLYRYKTPPFRIIFEWRKSEIVITVVEINTRTDIKYREAAR
ncbi:type II toxin-antitoxin system RelE family toxin [Pyramidobacter piscolens]|uniref:type II toxin-antitoxin system RelE family toxin n=1 Tax=Pyramidobacter piscolens TaxID=638849 RepID=UPI00266516D5|nr:type II toxin-antitoxin system RelE/ParE family toxin [Pyramidobacter piscolens]